MDGTRFDGWTRRRFGVAAGGMAVALLGPGRATGSEAQKHKRRKKRCQKLGEACVPGGKRRCCHGRACGGPLEARFCCKQGGEPCAGPGACCNLTCVDGFCALN